MKITVDNSLPDLSDEERAEVREQARRADDHPEEFREITADVQEIVFSPQVLKEMEEAGLTQDQVVSALLRQMGRQN